MKCMEDNDNLMENKFGFRCGDSVCNFLFLISIDVLQGIQER